MDILSVEKYISGMYIYEHKGSRINKFVDGLQFLGSDHMIYLEIMKQFRANLDVS